MCYIAWMCRYARLTAAPPCRAEREERRGAKGKRCRSCFVCRVCVSGAEPRHWSTTKPPWTQWGNYRSARCFRAVHTLITRPSTSDVKSPAPLLGARKDTHRHTNLSMLPTNNSNLNWLMAHWCISVKAPKYNAAHNREDEPEPLLAAFGHHFNWRHFFGRWMERFSQMKKIINISQKNDFSTPLRPLTDPDGSFVLSQRRNW